MDPYAKRKKEIFSTVTTNSSNIFECIFLDNVIDTSGQSIESTRFGCFLWSLEKDVARHCRILDLVAHGRSPVESGSRKQVSHKLIAGGNEDLVVLWKKGNGKDDVADRGVFLLVIVVCEGG